MVELNRLTLLRGRLRAVHVTERLTDGLVGLDLGDGRGGRVVEVEWRRHRHGRWSCLSYYRCAHVVTTVLNYCCVGRPETITCVLFMSFLKWLGGLITF